MSGAGDPTHRRLGRDALISLGGAVLTRGGVLLLQVAVARRLGVDDFNFFVTATVVGALVFFASDVGLTQAAILIARGDEQTCAVLVRALRRSRLVTLAAGIVVGSVALGAIAGFSGPLQAVTGVLLVASYALQSFSLYLRAPLMAASRVGTETQLAATERSVAVVGGLAGMAAGHLVWVAVGQFAGTLYGVAVAHRRGAGVRRVPVRWSRSVIRYGATVSVAVIATLLYARLDYLVIVRVRSDADAAVYAAAYTLILAGSLLPAALAGAALAHLPGRRATEERTYLRIAALIGALGGSGIAVLGPVTVRSAFGLDHGDLGALCLVLGGAFFMVAVNSTIGVMAPMMGAENHLLAIVGSAAALNLGLCLALIGWFGIVGGGVATLATEVYVAALWWAGRARPRARQMAEPPTIEILTEAAGRAG